MKNASMAFAFMCLIGVAPKPALSAGCDGILSLTRNLTYEQKGIRIADQLYSSYCKGAELKESSSLGLDLDTVIKNVPLGLRLDSGNAQEKVEHLCSNYGNCSPLLGGSFGIVQLDHVGGLSGKRDLDGD
ncbi:MAG: hypothetical protein OXH79_07305, partial [Boseongicola sp.]|nr:hypothetical protein [Boseongicola sp.]